MPNTMKMTTLSPKYSSPELSVCPVSAEAGFATSGVYGVSTGKIVFDENEDRMDI